MDFKQLRPKEVKFEPEDQIQIKEEQIKKFIEDRMVLINRLKREKEELAVRHAHESREVTNLLLKAQRLQEEIREIRRRQQEEEESKRHEMEKLQQLKAERQKLDAQISELE